MTRGVMLTASLAATLFVVPAGVALDHTPGAVDVQAIGPKVGERVADFTLRDQSGQPRTLKSTMGPKGLMLVFFRSADW
jgi:cytochrome oxidase Cu insertion factor (SCO1/SenC/PrrC family)